VSAIEELKAFVEKVNRYPDPIKDEKDRVFQFDLSDAATIQIELKDGKAYLLMGIQKDADVSLNLTEQHLHKLLVDELNATMAYMTGQVKVDGKIGLALTVLRKKSPSSSV
jgi:putative sterol carrier protein